MQLNRLIQNVTFRMRIFDIQNETIYEESNIVSITEKEQSLTPEGSAATGFCGWGLAGDIGITVHASSTPLYIIIDIHTIFLLKPQTWKLNIYLGIPTMGLLILHMARTQGMINIILDWKKMGSA